MPSTNSFQALLCLQKLKHSLCWGMQFLKKVTYIRVVIAKLSKFIQNSMQTFLYSFFTKNSWKIKKGLELVSIFHRIF